MELSGIERKLSGIKLRGIKRNCVELRRIESNCEELSVIVWNELG